MKFKKSISVEDLKVHKNLLEKLFSTTHDNGVCQIDSYTVQLCIKIFVNTFIDDESHASDKKALDLCPICRTGSLLRTHLSYYKKTVKNCNVCNYCVDVSGEHEMK